MISPITCPICDSTLAAGEADSPLFPFCSRRCKQVDLLRWWNGDYAVIDPLRAEDMEEAEASGELPFGDEQSP